MVFTLIVLILLVVFLAFFVGKNLSSVCSTFWFFKNYQNVSGILLVLIAFAAGILVALLCVCIYKLKSNPDDSYKRERKLKKRASLAVLEEKEKKEHHFGFGKPKAEKLAKSENTEKSTPAEERVKRTSLARSSENAGKEGVK